MTRKKLKDKIPKIRHTWGRNPKTKVKPSDKIYSRAASKRGVQGEDKDV